MTLSGGQKQRLFIVLALINNPQVVFLDELTTGLDPQSRRAIRDLVRGIRERGKSVFLTTHLMEEAERLCDRVAIIEYGRIIDIDRPERLVERHCPERTVMLVTEDPSAEEGLRAIPRADAVIHEDCRFTLRGRGDDFVIGTWSILAIGFPIASIVPTARLAQPIGAAILYPMIGLSGLFIPVEALPPALKAIARVAPLTYAVSLRQGIWKGEAWWAHAGDVVALILVFLVCTVLSAKVFRWE